MINHSVFNSWFFSNQYQLELIRHSIGCDNKNRWFDFQEEKTRRVKVKNSILYDQKQSIRDIYGFMKLLCFLLGYNVEKIVCFELLLKRLIKELKSNGIMSYSFVLVALFSLLLSISWWWYLVINKQHYEFQRIVYSLIAFQLFCTYQSIIQKDSHKKWTYDHKASILFLTSFTL